MRSNAEQMPTAPNLWGRMRIVEVAICAIVGVTGYSIGEKSTPTRSPSTPTPSPVHACTASNIPLDGWIGFMSMPPIDWPKMERFYHYGKPTSDIKDGYLVGTTHPTYIPYGRSLLDDSLEIWQLKASAKCRPDDGEVALDLTEQDTDHDAIRLPVVGLVTTFGESDFTSEEFSRPPEVAVFRNGRDVIAIDFGERVVRWYEFYPPRKDH